MSSNNRERVAEYLREELGYEATATNWGVFIKRSDENGDATVEWRISESDLGKFIYELSKSPVLSSGWGDLTFFLEENLSSFEGRRGEITGRSFKITASE